MKLLITVFFYYVLSQYAQPNNVESLYNNRNLDNNYAMCDLNYFVLDTQHCSWYCAKTSPTVVTETVTVTETLYNQGVSILQGDVVTMQFKDCNAYNAYNTQIINNRDITILDETSSVQCIYDDSMMTSTSYLPCFTPATEIQRTSIDRDISLSEPTSSRRKPIE